MSHQITRMERRGLVTKERSAGDNRGIDVMLTRHGLEVIEEAAPNHVALVRTILFDVLGKDCDYEKIIPGPLTQLPSPLTPSEILTSPGL